MRHLSRYINRFHGLLVSSYLCPRSAHAGYMGTDGDLLPALILQETSGDLIHALSHRHDNTLPLTNQSSALPGARQQHTDSMVHCQNKQSSTSVSHPRSNY